MNLKNRFKRILHITTISILSLSIHTFSAFGAEVFSYPWDINRDGQVDISDILLVGSQLGEKVSEPKEKNPDVNGDGEVNILDLILVARHIGDTYNRSPVIQAQFPDEIIARQGDTDLDKIFALPIRGYDADDDPLTWSVLSPQGIEGDVINDTLNIWSERDFFGYGEIEVKLEDSHGDFDSVAISVTVIKSNNTLPGPGEGTEYYVPWHPDLDRNRILSVEKFIMEEGYFEDALDRSIHHSRWRKMEFIRDVEFTSTWMNEATNQGWTEEAMKMRIDYMLDELRYVHVDTIRVRLPYFMESVDSTTIIQLFDYSEVNEGTTRLSIPDWGLRYIVDQAHNKGMKVMMLPSVINGQDFSRSEIHPTDWQLWFDNYGDEVYRLADLAKDTGVDFFTVGQALINFSGTISNLEWSQNMSNVLHRSRVYKGPIAYLDSLFTLRGNQQPNDWRQYPFLWEVDIIGTTLMYSDLVTGSNLSESIIIRRYPNVIDRYISPLSELSKPIIAYENGVPSMEGVLNNFLDFIAARYKSPIVDMHEQELWYDALFQALEDEPWFFGFGWFGISWRSLGGVQDTGLTFRGKLAEDIVRYYYGNSDSSKRIIRIDGDFADWQPDYHLVSDPLNDIAIEGPDLIGLDGVRDDMYLYLRVGFGSGLQDDNSVIFNFDLNGDDVVDQPCSSFYSKKWKAFLNADMTYTERSGILDIMLDDSGRNLELRIPLRLFDYSQYIGVRVDVNNRTKKARVDKTDSFFSVR
ncbi:dockerin type I domain-containing protein [Candidatus Poribacteria bacterium]